MVASQETAGPAVAVTDVAKLLPELQVLSNAEAVNRFEQGGFTYFRQISTVLTTVTLSFAVLLIAVLLTVSVNQRLGEIAALRALGFSRWRVVADVLCESVLIVGGGGLLSLPLGALLAAGRDRRHRGALSDSYCRQASDCRDAARRGDRLNIVHAAQISRIFPMAAGPVTAVADVTLQIAAGDHLAIRGPSGCGKSTLLHMLGCVETPTSGTLLFRGDDVTKLSDRQRSLLRLRQIGFVFQRFFLLPMLTAAENIELPQSESGVPKAEQRKRTRELLEYVGLAARADHRPSELSGGEMQRVAIARALANRPGLLLADEPTGELDRTTGEQIAALLDRVNADGTALVIVTHDPALAERCTRVLTMRDGRIESESSSA